MRYEGGAEHDTVWTSSFKNHVQNSADCGGLLAVHHKSDELRAARGIELLENPVEVRFHRMLAQGKLGRDLLIRTALAHILDNLFLSGGDAIYLAGLGNNSGLVKKCFYRAVVYPYLPLAHHLQSLFEEMEFGVCGKNAMNLVWSARWRASSLARFAAWQPTSRRGSEADRQPSADCASARLRGRRCPRIRIRVLDRVQTCLNAAHRAHVLDLSFFAVEMMRRVARRSGTSDFEDRQRRRGLDLAHGHIDERARAIVLCRIQRVSSLRVLRSPMFWTASRPMKVVR